MLQLGGHQNRDGGQMDDQVLVEIGDADDVDVSVENAGGDKECFLLVVFLLVQVKNLLYSERTKVLRHPAILFLADGACNFLAEGLFLVLLDSEVVLHSKRLLERSDSQVAALGEFRVVLMLWAYLLSLVEHWILVHDILDIDVWQVHICLLPSLLHDLREVSSVVFVLAVVAVRVYGGLEIRRDVALRTELSASGIRQTL